MQTVSHCSIDKKIYSKFTELTTSLLVLVISVLFADVA